MRRIPGVKLALLHQRVKFNLVYHRSDAGFIDDFADDEPGNYNADAFLPAPRRELAFPGVDVMVNCRNRPGKRFTSIELQFFKAFLQRFFGLF